MMSSRSAVTSAVVADPAHTLLALDFDGTLSPIVEDPAQAFIHPDSLVALSRLGASLGAIAIVTGRPVRQARELGRFDGVEGLEQLVICGQYGAERWDASTGEYTTADPPDSIRELRAKAVELLRDMDGPVSIEDKGLAVALHTRRAGAHVFDQLLDPLRRLAADLGLTVEPGRHVIEVRAPGSDKGMALRSLVEEFGVSQVVYAGDDLGDLPAFAVVAGLRAEGINGHLVCSASEEQAALVPLADVVLDGPDDVAEWLTELADAVNA